MVGVKRESSFFATSDTIVRRSPTSEAISRKALNIRTTSFRKSSTFSASVIFSHVFFIPPGGLRSCQIPRLSIG